MKPDVEIYDTTLRDGSQGEGVNFSVKDKLRIAERLDTFGMHYIEGGWPGSNPKDIEFFELAKQTRFKRAKLAAFGSTRRKGVQVAADDLWEDLAAACEGGLAHDTGGEPGDDRRHGAVSQGAREICCVRRGACL
jgi:isopropylmalate/homocitrate/citramalate synthase